MHMAENRKDSHRNAAMTVRVAITNSLQVANW